MILKLTVCILDELGNFDEPLAAPFRKFAQVRVADTFSDPEQLMRRVAEGDIDVIAINLSGPSSLAAVEQIARTTPECGILGVSAKNDAAFIIQAMRAGCAQFVCWPIDHEDLTNALHRVKPARKRRTHGSKRVCIIGSSGGAGATTIACNLAMELAQLTEQPTALVDMNLEFGDVCCAFDATPKYTVADVCHDGAEVDAESAVAAFHDLPCGVSILARPENVDLAREVTPDGVEHLLGLAAKHYNHILIDLPRAYNFLSAVAVGGSDYNFIVAQLAVPSIRNAMRIYNCLQQMGSDEESIHIVLNRCNAEFERLSTKDVEDHFRRPVFAVIPNDYKFVSASLDLGHPIGADAPASRARSAIGEMAKIIAPEFASAESATTSASGLFGKLLGRRPKS
jgi:pilus assembly protein CpaE